MDLLRWFDRSRRDLPWRRTADPYAIWISEVMLQQTQVATVIPYFEKFLAAFPTVADLAGAPLDDVLSKWSGLGYYSRARNLHRAAKELVEKHGGALPNTVEALLTLPGFGRYTAGAVASIAFGVRAPLVDGNVSRVLTRVYAVEGARPEKRIWEIAESLVPADRPGDHNQALMELGATVCTPANPTCLLCPLRDQCQALAQGRVHELPPPRVRAKRKELKLAVAVCRQADKVLAMRKAEHGLFGGLWELPSAPREALRALIGKKAVIDECLGTVKRTLTHRTLILELWASKPEKRLQVPAGYDELRWVTPEELEELGISAATRAVLAYLKTETLGPARRRKPKPKA